MDTPLGDTRADGSGEGEDTRQPYLLPLVSQEAGYLFTV